MLVLTRKVGEEIIIGGDIRIRVVDVRGGKVRIGVVASVDVLVDRQEIHEKRLSFGNDWDSRPPEPMALARSVLAKVPAIYVRACLRSVDSADARRRGGEPPG